ncbi:MAG: hypothetical protein ACLFTQ_02600 [Candidatus Aenigmatarchaeota archaeon]
MAEKELMSLVKELGIEEDNPEEAFRKYIRSAEKSDFLGKTADYLEAAGSIASLLGDEESYNEMFLDEINYTEYV